MAVIVFYAEENLQKTIHTLTASGKSKKARQCYDKAVQSGIRMVSAKTDHLAYVAARDMMADAFELKLIEERAQEREDYPKYKDDFDRDRAVHLAEVERKFSTARFIMARLRSRGRYKRNHTRRVLEELASVKIDLFEGNIRAAKRRLNKPIFSHEMSKQIELDVAWWRFVASCVAEDHGDAWRQAIRALRSHKDRKLLRYLVWIIAAVPGIGPPTARRGLRRKLGL